MRAKMINENGNLPWGAQDDRMAPWNEVDSSYLVSIENGELIMYDEDNEDVMITFDPYDIDKLISDKLNLNFNQREDDGETFDLIDVQNNDFYAIIHTDLGEVKVTYDELLELEQ